MQNSWMKHLIVQKRVPCAYKGKQGGEYCCFKKCKQKSRMERKKNQHMASNRVMDSILHNTFPDLRDEITANILQSPEFPVS